MPLGNSPDRQAAVDRFWSNHLFVLKNNGVSAKLLHWYRRHVEVYIRAHEGATLSHHTGQNIDRYLNAKGRLPGLKEWQFRQIADALRLLFKEFICLDWAKAYDWYQWRAFARVLEPDHPSLNKISPIRSR